DRPARRSLRLGDGGLQELLTAPGERDAVAGPKEGLRDGLADAAAGARDDGELAHGALLRHAASRRASHDATSWFSRSSQESGPGAASGEAVPSNRPSTTARSSRLTFHRKSDASLTNRSRSLAAASFSGAKATP